MTARTESPDQITDETAQTIADVALIPVLQARDSANAAQHADLLQLIAGQRLDLEQHASLLQQLIAQLNETTQRAAATDARLAWYEARVPQLATHRKAYDKAVRREQQRRERLVAAHPELNEQGHAFVRATGTLPPAPAMQPPMDAAEREGLGIPLTPESNGTGPHLAP